MSNDEAGSRPPLVVDAAPSDTELTLSGFRRAMAGDPFDLFDPAGEGAAQFAGRQVVVDMGGWGQRAHTELAVQAGVGLWHVVGYGLDHLDVEFLLSNGITVAHTPGSCSAVALGEHAMLLMLACSRQLKLAFSNLQRGVLYEPWTAELGGRELLIVGVGASGAELSQRARAFGMRVVGIDVAPGDADHYQALGIERVGRPEELHEMIASADFISLHLPLNRSTRHIIDAEALAAAKPTAILINVARGALVDEQALLAGLNSGALGGAGLDVFENESGSFHSELTLHDKVVATPHTAGATLECIQRRVEIVVDNIARVARGEKPQHTVSAEDGYVGTGGVAEASKSQSQN